MAASNQDTDIAKQLHTWAMKEMHFHPQGNFMGSRMPSPDDLKGICRGNLQADMWRYIIKHVHSVQTVKKVRLNLQLKSKISATPYSVKYKSDKKYADEHQALLSQRAQLLGEVTTLLSQVQQLEQEVGRMSGEIQTAEQEYQQGTEALRDQARKTCLLDVYCAKCTEAVAQDEVYANQLDEKLDSLSNKQGDATLHLKPEECTSSEACDIDRKSSQLETTASRQVRQTCEMIGMFLQSVLQGTSDKDKPTAKVNKDQLWTQVENTLNSLDIRHIVGALVQLSQMGMCAVQENTAKISIKDDAKKLKFNYEEGSALRDISFNPTVLQSVHQLLEDCQTKHVLRFVEAQKHRNNAHAQIEVLEKARKKIKSSLRKYLVHQRDNIPLAWALVQARLDLIADTTAKSIYAREAESLKEKIAAGQKERRKLKTFHKKIQDFSELANAKQQMIQVIAKQNAGAQSRLGAQKQDVVQYISGSLLTHEMEIQTLTASLKDNMTMEVEKFVSLSLPYLVFLYFDSVTKCGLLDLSIHFNSHPATIMARQPLQSMLTRLDFPPYKAAEYLIRHCLRLKQELEVNEERMKLQRENCNHIQVVSGMQTSLSNISELCENVSAQDKQELEKLLPLLQKRISRAACASTECIRVKDTLQAWWDQPAQFLTPWLTAEGLTFQQWYNKWRIITTKIRQLSINK